MILRYLFLFPEPLAPHAILCAKGELILGIVALLKGVVVDAGGVVGAAVDPAFGQGD
jgi:hypothetical protein